MLPPSTAAQERESPTVLRFFWAELAAPAVRMILSCKDQIASLDNSKDVGHLRANLDAVKGSGLRLCISLIKGICGVYDSR